MTAVGGSLESISIDGRLFPVTADADGNRNLGGFKNDLQPNGDGTARLVKERINWSYDGITIEVDDARADQEFLQKTADSNDFVTITITHASQVTYQGKCTIVDEIAYSSNKSTAQIKLGGPGKLTQQ
jgi:hypothetical protein